MSRQVIHAVVPYMLHQSQNLLADRSHLDAALLELLLSELETNPSVPTL